MRGRLIAALAVLAAAWPVASADAAGRCGNHPWCDTSLSPSKRADLLIAALTPAERIGLLAGDSAAGISGMPHTHTGAADGVPRLDVPPLYLTDGPVGVRQGPSTAMPSSMSIASTFNLTLARSDGAVIGNEAKLKGDDVVYAPTINLLRTPLWGRAFESLGEDPLLTARLGVAWIRGLQAQGVMANVKHFAVNNQENARYSIDARVDERTLFEMYLSQFEAAVKQGHAGSVMCSYNRLNGPHTCESTWLLRQVLRKRWGFEGFVLADYGASKHIGSGLLAGLDFEPFPYVDFDGGENFRPELIQAAIAAHHTTQAHVDAAAHNLLRELFAFGLFDRAAFVDDDSRVDRTAHAEQARRLAEAGTVLLRNKGGLLPLNARKLKSLAIIGADADRYKNGGGSADVQPYSFVTPRAGIAARAGPGVKVSYDAGDDLAHAASVASGADAAVVVVADTAGEGEDKPCLALDCGATDQLKRDRLIARVAAANPRTVVVLETAGPVLTPWRNRVRGIVEAWYPGSGGGAAIARVLFGDVDPGGRLPATFPRRARDLPTAGSKRRYPGVKGAVHYTEGVFVGYRWYDARRIAPAFPFGFGLSYTRFVLRHPRASRHGVSIEVVNTGRRTGVAVPQLYLGLPAARGRPQPPRALKGFASVRLEPGASRRVRFAIDSRALSYWNVRKHRWTVAPGCYRWFVGSSSRDIAASGRLRCVG
ncbi:MAG TPA: glycoside hydrolase family 3 C-terminal domain-containing protein [Thermoleophilaceae bacterium]|nr:glycoside hydrolase family 3 C-terminal domain-containing protein [Thermoleophilaceae bacterium]